MDYLNLPFTQFDPAYLESLPDEVFFAKRFRLSKEDEELLLKNSSMVHGRRFYRNPLVRFGKEYVYSSNGELVPFHRFVASPTPSEEQKKMIREASLMPVVYSDDCPKSSPERLRRFREFGARRRQHVT